VFLPRTAPPRYIAATRWEPATLEKNLNSPRKKPRPDPGHTPGIEVLEKSTETAWGLFQSLQEKQQRSYVETAQADLPEVAVQAAAGELTLDDVLAEIRRNNRVCPRPAVWKKLYDYLPNKTAQLASIPATLQEWNTTPPLQKRAHLRQHIEWAAAQGVLKQVHKALVALPEEKWYHMGE
jgi:hypothetical protein